MVIVGLAASWILVCFPFPQTSRVELRKSLARTIQDIGKAFGILSANAITGLGSASPEQVKGFNQLAIELRRQVSQEYTLLHNSAYEPPLRGRFPVQSYKLLLEKVDNMADLVIGMVILIFFFKYTSVLMLQFPILIGRSLTKNSSIMEKEHCFYSLARKKGICKTEYRPSHIYHCQINTFDFSSHLFYLLSNSCHQHSIQRHHCHPT
jgi:hypothetical protein